jgi:hypothetical protein
MDAWCRSVADQSLLRVQLLAAVLALVSVPGAYAQSPVLQRGYDSGVSGATLTEKTLNTSNVLPGHFGLVFRLAVGDSIMAQPLYVPDVVVNKVTHNVLYVATMSDMLYAFDADVGGSPLWTRNLATFEKATPVTMASFAYAGNRNLIHNLGILSTPVIDRSTNTLYAVACTLENDTLVYRLHAIDILTGALRPRSGVVISGSHGGMSFDARTQWQRISLVLSGTNVVFGFGALEAESTAHLYSGWVMAYDKSTLAQTGVFATETIGNGGGGVWQSGRPPAVDTSGNVYVISGNAFDIGGYDGVHNFGQSVLKLNPAEGLRLIDWFTPSNWATLDDGDLDLTSSGPMLIPGTSLLVGGGKTGVLYVLNINHLGKHTTNDSGAIQKLRISTLELRGGPVYWHRAAGNGGPLLYDWSAGDRVKAYRFNGSTFATAPSAQGGFTERWPGGILSLSANGSTAGSGVLWATVTTSGDAENNPPTPGELYALDAANVAHVLWRSDLDAARDSLGNFAKFVPPLVANGRVYVASWSNHVAVYGLLSTAPALTGVSPGSGPVTGGTAVTLTGKNFTSGTTASVGGVPMTHTVVVSATRINAVTAPHSQGAVSVVVTNPGGQNARIADAFTFLAPGSATAASQ